MGPGDFLKVTYQGRQRRLPDGTEYYDSTTPFILMWDAKKYQVPVGQSAFAPFEAVSVAAGDPRSNEGTQTIRDESGNVGWVVDRPTEVRRLRTLYDNQTGDLHEIKFAPQLTVEDLEGNAIRTVLDDPEGESVLPAETTILDREQLLAQVQRQQRMIEQLATAQGIDLGTVETQTSEPDEPSNTEDPFASVPEG
jgi:hypothetical protein